MNNCTQEIDGSPKAKPSEKQQSSDGMRELLEGAEVFDESEFDGELPFMGDSDD